MAGLTMIEFDYKSLTYRYYPERHEVRLGDGELYLIEEKTCVVKTLRNANHGDVTTVIAKSIPPIPKDTELYVEKIWQNFYGKWVQVFYNNRFYDISPHDLIYVRRDREKLFQ
jgi:hypothetical protein